MQSCFWPTPDFRVPTGVFRYKPVSSSLALSVLGIKLIKVIVLSYSCMVANRSESILLYLVPINVSASHYVRFSVDTLSLVPWWSHPHPCAMQSQQPQGMQGWKIKKRWRDGGRFAVTDCRTLLVCIPRGVNNSWLFAFRVYDTDDDSGEEGITGIFVCCSFVLYSSTGGNVSNVIRCYHKRCMIHDS